MREPKDTGTNPDSRADAREARLQSLFAAADPGGDPSAALTERITELRVRRAQTLTRPRPWAQPVLRWCALGLTCAALMAAWAIGRRDHDSAIADAIRATASAPALHFHGGGKHERQEVWYLEGVGCYLYSKDNRSPETILVDDMKHEYRYEIPERRVFIRRSLMADPMMRLTFWENHSATGVLNQLRSAVGSKAPMREETVVRNGQTVRQVTGPFIDSRWANRFTIDPKTDRLLITETNRPCPDGTIDRVRFVHEYPDPKDVDRAIFQFKIPDGVTVIDETKPR